MKLGTEFIQLPLRFDVERLTSEIAAFTEADWREHPSRYEGNSAIPLISAFGEGNDDLQGPMLPTPYLKRCPYIQQVLASFNTVIGRSRLMRLAPRHSVPRHYDSNYYWFNRTRVHIPILTDPAVKFVCNEKSVHMGAGEAWTFDNWQMHEVIHSSDRPRIHLVFDTCGSADFWRVVEESHQLGQQSSPDSTKPPRCYFVRFDPEQSPQFPLERAELPPVMSPAEVDIALLDMIQDLDIEEVPPEQYRPFIQLLHAHRYNWRSLWTTYGINQEGYSHYQQLLKQTLSQAKDIGQGLTFASNQSSVIVALETRLAASLQASTPAPTIPSSFNIPRTPLPLPKQLQVTFHQPVFIVAAPRSGSTLLFETLSQSKVLWTVGGESHHQFESIQALHPSFRGYASNRLTSADATSEVSQQLLANFARSLQSHAGTPLTSLSDPPVAIRLLEKTPKNSLRIPFLQKVFPQARFIFLHRNPAANISSIISAWESGRFVTYPHLPDWHGMPWSLILPPQWRELEDASLAEIAAFQWRSTNQTMLEDLQQLPPEQWCAVSYEQFLANPEAETERLCTFASIPFGRNLKRRTSNALPHSRFTLSSPHPNKWQRHEIELAPILPQMHSLAEQLRSLVPEAVGV